MKEIDPRLLAQLDAAGESGAVEAIVWLRRPSARAAAGAGDTTEQVMARVSETVQEQPAQVRHLPRLNGLFVRGSGKLVRRLLEEDAVEVASTPDAELTTDAQPSQDDPR